MCATPAALCSIATILGSGVHAIHESCMVQVDAIIGKVHKGLWWKSVLSAPASLLTIVAFAVNSVVSGIQ